MGDKANVQDEGEKQVEIWKIKRVSANEPSDLFMISRPCLCQAACLGCRKGQNYD